jgi:hypothetical protein
MANVYEKMQGCLFAQFSKLKFVNGSNFQKFKEYFLAQYKGGFVVPANTFDNVKGQFPIGFTIWDTSNKEKIKEVVCDVYEKDRSKIGQKTFYGDLPESINVWLKNFYEKSGIAVLSTRGNDFQNQKYIYLATKIDNDVHDTKVNISIQNLFPICIYFAVRHCIKATWLNDRDQFLFPNNKWEKDTEFQNDCLAFTLFHGQNKITSKEGTNHWIPFSEYEVNAREKFESNFMKDFMDGKLKDSTLEEDEGLFGKKKKKLAFPKLVFSPVAQEVFKAGLELWKYYHRQPNCNVNASLYDIKEYFQGRNDKGKMNNTSTDETYTKLISDLRDKLQQLAEKIEPKVYEYGFLKQ